jgi:hypothetical protein
MRFTGRSSKSTFFASQKPFFQKVLKTLPTTFLPSVKTLTKNRF